MGTQHVGFDIVLQIKIAPPRACLVISPQRHVIASDGFRIGVGVSTLRGSYQQSIPNTWQILAQHSELILYSSMSMLRFNLPYDHIS